MRTAPVPVLLVRAPEGAADVPTSAQAAAVDSVKDTVVVTLRGKVRSLAERAAAQDAALSAPGVTAVVNQLTVEA